MPSIVVNYADNTTTTVSGTSVALTATTGGQYYHSSKKVESLDFTLGSSTSGTITVTPASGPMPAQSCYARGGVGQALPFDADWNVSSGVGTLTLTIPSVSSNTYLARLEITGQEKVDITVEH